MAEQLAPQIVKVIQKIEKEERYTALVDKDMMMDTHSKKWASGSCSMDKDITSKIIEECNQYPITYSTK
jgi:Skp family chaperone for outer membrane proteins